MVGGDAAGGWRGIGAVRGAAGVGGHRPEAVAGLLHRGEHGADLCRVGCCDIAGSPGAASAATVAMAAALLHLAAHAGFKCLGFLCAGSVLASTGLRGLDRLGGLARRMPATTILFGVAALGASGLPLVRGSSASGCSYSR